MGIGGVRMNDRFKFRGITKGKVNEFVYGSLLWYAGEPQIWDKDGKNYIVKPKTVQQCTGLKDKNGKLIYEGDIVERKNGFSIKRGVVYFNEVFTQFDATNMSHYSLVNRSIVLGNIYQNPELLEDN